MTAVNRPLSDDHRNNVYGSRLQVPRYIGTLKFKIIEKCKIESICKRYTGTAIVDVKNTKKNKHIKIIGTSIPIYRYRKK